MFKLKNFFKSFYNIYLTFLGVIVSLPLLAPVFLHLGLIVPAKVIYFIYSFFCHQFASRSINIYDYQFAWCARDTAIWIGIFITAILVRNNKLPKLRWYWVIPFIIPMALDGGLQTIFTLFNLSPAGILDTNALYVSSNLSRFMTGAIFGIGVGWWLSQQLKAQSTDEESKKELNQGDRVFKRFNHIFLSLILTSTLFLIYFVFVQVWNLSSIENKPLNSLDFAVKTPNGSFFARRENAICPTENPEDLLRLDCFFKN